VVVCATAVLLRVYLGRRSLAAKYLIPGTILLAAFQLYPVIYTASTAFTNYGDGHRLAESQAVEQIEADSVQPVAGAPTYQLSVATKGNAAIAPFVFFLTGPDGTVYLGTSHAMTRVPARQVRKDPASGRVVTAKGWMLLSPAQIDFRSAALDRFAVPVHGGFIKAIGVSQAYTGRQTISYHPASDTMTDTTTGVVYRPSGDHFVAANGSGKVLEPGWETGVGFANFTALLTSSQIRDPFLSILAWTIAFAAGSVAFAFAFGLLLAMVLDHPRMRGRRLYRSLLLLPYALPAFISLLVWQSMYNQDFGLLNNLLGLHVDWLGGTWTARAAVLITNVWLTFPYMMLICTGVLQSLPTELKEAAQVDGASPVTAFRRVTLPLLMVSATPLLIASFAFNFNNFNAIRLLTDGGPFPPGNSTAGQTDILISYTFRLAFGGQGARYGLASATSIIIFALIAIISLIGFRRTRALEEVFR
jgi:arabinogalactan oligomer/maltooligosaccharide transport system permease protein